MRSVYPNRESFIRRGLWVKVKVISYCIRHTMVIYPPQEMSKRELSFEILEEEKHSKSSLNENFSYVVLVM